jgi:hypothetical protein
MFSTWDRYPAAAGRWLRDATRRRRDPMAEFIASIDIMMYVVGVAFAASLIAIVVD